MTEEEKQLLLVDLCARLPYGVVCYNSNTKNNFKLCDIAYIDSGYPTFNYGYGELETVKPYLRPISSITEEETFDYYKSSIELGCIPELPIEPRTLATDWLNKHHFDYRGLIEKGLALEATEDMYKEKQQ